MTAPAVLIRSILESRWDAETSPGAKTELRRALELRRELGHAKPTTTLTYYAHWIPTGDKRFIDRLQAIRGAAKVEDGSKTVAASFEDAADVRESKWSRGRELNPRPTDYESVALPLSYPGIPRT